MGGPLDPPGEQRVAAPARARVVLRCTYCHDDLARDEAAFCATCLAPHHGACQRLHGRCAAPGCCERAVVRPRGGGRRPRRRPESARGRWRRQSERTQRAAELAAAPLARSTLMALGALVIAVASLEGAYALAARWWRTGTPAVAPAVVVVRDRAPAPPVQAPPAPRTQPNARLQLTADGFTFPLLLAPDERLVVLRTVQHVHVARLDPDGSAHAAFVSLGPVDVRLPAGQDAVSLDGAEPVTVDVETLASGQQLLRRRRASPDEARRALETTR